MERYNPLAEGHIERIGRTAHADSPVYAMCEPEHPAALAYLKEWGYVLGKWVLAGGAVATAYIYKGNEHPSAMPEDDAAAGAEAAPPAEAEPEAAPEPDVPVEEPDADGAFPHPEGEKCEKCGEDGDGLEFMDADKPVYGVFCKCGHAWIVTRAEVEA
jgi:hypothetical protein